MTPLTKTTITYLKTIGGEMFWMVSLIDGLPVWLTDWLTYLVQDKRTCENGRIKTEALFQWGQKFVLKL